MGAIPRWRRRTRSYDPLPPRCRLGRPDPLEGALNRYSEPVCEG